MYNNLQTLKFMEIISTINKAFRENVEFVQQIKDIDRDGYYDGLNLILRNQEFKILKGESEMSFSDGNLMTEHKLAILDCLNIVEEACNNCGLLFSKPLSYDQLQPECSFCHLVKNFYFNKGGYDIVIDMNVTSAEAEDNDVYVVWNYKFDNKIQDYSMGYIKNFARFNSLNKEYQILRYVREKHEEYTSDDLKNLPDKELRKIIYDHNSSKTKMEAINNVKSKKILHTLFHSLHEFKEEIINRFFEIGGHNFDLMFFLLPPFINTGQRGVDGEYQNMKAEFEKDLEALESKYPYWVETSRRITSIPDEEGEEVLDEEIPTSADLEYMKDEAKLGSAISLGDLVVNKQIKMIIDVITDPESLIPFDIRLIHLLYTLPMNDFQFNLDKVLDIKDAEPSIWAPGFAQAMILKIKDSKLRSKLLNHPHFTGYKRFKDYEMEKNKMRSDEGFT